MYEDDMNEDDLLDNDFDEILNDMLNNWPSPFVARNNIQEFTCGLYKPSTLSTSDYHGKGIRNKYWMQNKVFYRAMDIVDWIAEKKSKHHQTRNYKYNDENMFEEIREKCHKTILTRKEVQLVSGGIICATTLRNIDSQDKGIPNRSRIGNKIVYNLDNVIYWFQNNFSKI